MMRKKAKSMQGLSGSLLRFLERVLPKYRSTTPLLHTASSSLTPCFDLSFRNPSFGRMTPPSRSSSPSNSTIPSRRSSFSTLFSYVSASFSSSPPPSRGTSPSNSIPLRRRNSVPAALLSYVSNSNPPSRTSSFTSDVSVEGVKDMLEQAKSSLPPSP